MAALYKQAFFIGHAKGTNMAALCSMELTLQK
jgi:hypothetical protein